ncbi:hypothetical protein AAG570_003831, partial [Ranatra chinensis]
GEECKREGEQVWNCKAASECRHLDVKRRQPAICSFDDQDPLMPIICCPPLPPAPAPQVPSPTVDSPRAPVVLLPRPNPPPPPTQATPPPSTTPPNRERFSPKVAVLREYYLPAIQEYFFVEYLQTLIGYGPQEDKAWLCGGTLISDRYVLSAAHCSSSYSGDARWARLGELDHTSDADQARPEDFEISARYDHPDYKPPAVYNDISLYKLDRGVVFSDYIKPACLHPYKELPGSKAVVTGWGRTSFVGATSDHLLEVEIPIVEGEHCKMLMGVKNSTKVPNGIDTDTMVCAGDLAGGKDTCTGDSGGPLIFEDLNADCLKFLIGVTSYGRQCALPNSPGVYTRVSHYIAWIESIVWPPAT